MNFIRFFTLAIFLGLAALSVQAATPRTTQKITNFNYVCVHTQSSDTLVFKTTVPQKIWRTTLKQNGKIKLEAASELQNIQLNAATINIEGKAASFKGELTKNYEIKGLFQKQIDEEIPLTVVTTYTPDKTQKKDNYNCQLEKSDAPPVLLGSAESR